MSPVLRRSAKIVVAGAMGMQIRLDPFPDEVVIDGGGQAVQQLEPRGARHAMGRPGGSAFASARGCSMAAGSLTTGGVHGVGILAAVRRLARWP